MNPIKRRLMKACAFALWLGVGSTLIYLASGGCATERTAKQARTEDVKPPPPAPPPARKKADWYMGATKAPMGEVQVAEPEDTPLDGGKR